MDTKKFMTKLSISMLSIGMLFSNAISMNSVFAMQATTPSGVANLQEGGDASITITPNEGQSLIGKTFDVYKLFDAENSKKGESINYTMNEEYAPALKQVVAQRKGINDPDKVSEYEIIDYIQTLNNNVIEGAQASQTLEGRYSDYRYFLEDVRDSLDTLGINAKHSVTVTQTQGDGSFEITGLQYGYYLIDEVTNVQDDFSAASLIMVNTSNPSVSINVKSDYPTILKKIYEDDNNIEWNDIADFEIGQTVPFKYESTLANMNGYHSYYYAWHDTMDDALTFHDDSVNIEILDRTTSKSYTLKNKEFSVLTNVIAGETFLIEIEDIKAIVDREFPEEIDNLGHNKYDQVVILTYNATLNDNAASRTGRAGFENDVYLEFANDPDSDQIKQVGYPNSPIKERPSTGKTPIDTVVCFTYMINGLKINNYDCPLEDAKFRLFSDKACTEEVYVKEGNNGYIVMNRDVLGGDDHTGGSLSSDAVEMISDANGIFTIYGLDQGTYYLKETDSPAGYRELLDPIEIIVTPTFTELRQNYVKGEGATDKTLINLSATAEIKEFLSGMFDIHKEDLATNVQDGSLNITIVNTVGTKLPVTGSSMTVIMLGAGMALFAVAYATKKKVLNKK